MSLPAAVVEICQREALGQTLSEYNELTFDEVIESLEKDGFEVNSNDDIIVWEPFEFWAGDDIAEQIQSLYSAFEMVALSALESVS